MPTILASQVKSLFRDSMNEMEKLQPKPTFSRKYRRLDKPPYTYVAMTTLAIQASPQRRMSYLKKEFFMFEFKVCDLAKYCAKLKVCFLFFATLRPAGRIQSVIIWATTIASFLISRIRKKRPRTRKVLSNSLQIEKCLKLNQEMNE